MSTCIYIHIPFCLKKCLYCNFCSVVIDPLIVEKYINCLRQEIQELTSNFPINKVKTIYIGGGTPSLLSVEQIEKVISCFLSMPFENNYEFTIEVNPKTGSKSYFKDLKSIGINRISLGVQSFDPKLLRIAGRIHNVDDIYKAIKYIRSSGFENISIDLMYGLPHQSLSSWETCLNKALELDVDHVSTYGLKVEEKTPFYSLYNSESEYLPVEDDVVKMYLLVHDILESSGYNHYEISNFAKPHKESKHNFNYWLNNDYYGFGVSAHSYINRVRRENTSDLGLYLSDYKANNTITTVSDLQYEEDSIILGLRLFDGIDLHMYEKNFNVNFLKKFQKIIARYSDYFNITDDRVALNLSGMLLSNNILSEFIHV